jgi:hypothetical protein
MVKSLSPIAGGTVVSCFVLIMLKDEFSLSILGFLMKLGLTLTIYITINYLYSKIGEHKVIKELQSIIGIG